MGTGPGRESLRRHGAAFLVLVSAVALRFHRLVLEGVVQLNDEMADEYLPLASNIFAQIRRGAFPLWSPEILFGYPVSLTVDLHLFSPFSWPFLIWPSHVALAAQLLSVQLCAVLCMYALARRVGMSATAGTAAAVLWVTGCPADNLLLISMGLATVPWIPLVVLCWDHYGRSGDLRWATVTGGALGLAMLGGHMQFVYWTTVFLLGYLVVLRPLESWRHLAWRAARGIVIVSVVAVATAAVLVLPMTEILQDSIRASLDRDQRVHTGTLSLALTWRALRWTVFCGQEHIAVEGDVEFRSAGLLPVLLALLAWGRGRKLDNRLLLLALAFLVLSLGAVFAPSQWVVKALPLNQFRYPGRIALFFSLAVMLLAGRATDLLIAGRARRWPNLVFAGGLALLCLPGIAALMRSGQPVNASEGRRDLAAIVLLAASLALPSIGRQWLLLRRVLLAGACFWFVLHSVRMTNPPNPWTVARAWGPRAGLWSQRPGEIGRLPPPLLQQVPRKDGQGPTRMLHLDTALEHDMPLLSGHQAPTGLVSLRPGRVDRLVYARHLASQQEAPISQTVASRQPLLDLFNVQYLVVDPASFRQRFGAAQRERSLVVRRRLGARAVLVENLSHLPRSYFLSHATLVGSEAEAYGHVSNARFEPRREVLLEIGGAVSSPPDLGPGGEPQFRPALVSAYENERVQVEVDAPSAGWLVLLDRWAPGWSARLDGELAPVLRANYLFRAVRIPAGRHQVVFAYDAPMLRWGLALSAAGLLSVLAAAASLLRSRRR